MFSGDFEICGNNECDVGADEDACVDVDDKKLLAWKTLWMLLLMVMRLMVTSETLG